MANRKGIFAGDNPFDIARAWLREAEQSEPNDPNAMALSTVDASGLPNVRMVLLKEIAPDGFVFFTNYDSVKGQEVETAQKAAFVLHWKSLQRQIRVRGTVEREGAAASDAYYNSRALGSRVGAWASKQSQPLTSKAALMEAVAREGLKHGPKPKRPDFWGGYRIKPVEIEFWAAGEFRLHDRFRWVKTPTGTEVNKMAHEVVTGADASWSVTRLNP